MESENISILDRFKSPTRSNLVGVLNQEALNILPSWLHDGQTGLQGCLEINRSTHSPARSYEDIYISQITNIVHNKCTGIDIDFTPTWPSEPQPGHRLLGMPLLRQLTHLGS